MSPRPFFIVSSGRSGTAMLHKALSAVADVEMHHEYMVQITQPLAVRRYLELIGADETARVIAETFGGAIRYSNTTHWGDSSNKVSWLIPDLAASFPKARFVHLVRDGRKVASSYFHKLARECYDDRSTQILQAHYDDPRRNPAPPPEKKYWWPVPRRGSGDADRFRSFSQFERICWHWAELNRLVLQELSQISAERTLFVRLEELRAYPSEVRGLHEFLDLPYSDAAYTAFARPHNVNQPQDRLLTAQQRAQFDSIAGDMLARLGYAGQPEYAVNY
jgi:Sulfotransferase family